MTFDNINFETASIDDAKIILRIQKEAFEGQAKIYGNYKSTGTVTVWHSLKPFKIRWLFQMPLH
jgi:hypothetical protein